MTAYVLGALNSVAMGSQIAEYLARIDQTLQPHQGQFIVHGGPVTVLEGAWQDDVIIIAFPSQDAARAWYWSPAYQAILALRTANSKGDVILIDGVDPDHRATDILASSTGDSSGQGAPL